MNWPQTGCCAASASSRCCAYTEITPAASRSSKFFCRDRLTVGRRALRRHGLARSRQFSGAGSLGTARTATTRSARTGHASHHRRRTHGSDRIGDRRGRRRVRRNRASATGRWFRSASPAHRAGRSSSGRSSSRARVEEPIPSQECGGLVAQVPGEPAVVRAGRCTMFDARVAFLDGRDRIDVPRALLQLIEPVVIPAWLGRAALIAQSERRTSRSANADGNTEPSDIRRTTYRSSARLTTSKPRLHPAKPLRRSTLVPSANIVCFSNRVVSVDASHRTPGLCY
jgi:hypothetical protein